MPQQSQPTDDLQGKPKILPIHNNLINETCELILQQHADQLPDLSRVTILLSSSNAASYCRSVLLQKAASRGCHALLGPQVQSLESWLQQQVTIEPDVISNHARELLLVGALRQHSGIYQHGSPWILAESLMELFDELTLSHVNLPENLHDFIEQVTQAYGSAQEVSESLGKEALLVHTLWYATHQQLKELNSIDTYAAHLLRLGNSLQQIPSDRKFYFCGIDQATPAEIQWRNQLGEQNQLQLLLHNPNSLTTTGKAPDYLRCLDLVYDFEQGHFQSRAEQCHKQYPSSPVAPIISIYSADNAEDEALAVDIQIRRWLLEGKKHIGIVTENRKLARRIRALLDRANIQLEDDAGWPLSTTSAATVMERWLESIEQNFHYLPLLDCLKSPFVLGNDEAFMKNVYHLEQHIVVDEKVPSDIKRYLKHIEFRKNKLRDTMAVNYEKLTELIRTVEHAAEPLVNLCNGHSHPATQYLNALQESLHRLQVIDNYQQDEAGKQLLSELDQLQGAAQLVPTELDWIAFRSWLGNTLERFNFKIRSQGSPVKLITLASSEYYQFDALVIAGAEHNFLPHASRQSPFFNDSVRSALNIPTQSDKQALNYYYYRRLLASVSNTDNCVGPILITKRAKENDEEIITAPWITALQAFHQQAYGTDLTNLDLSQFINSATGTIKLDTAPLPSPVSPQPRAKIPEKLVPKSVSASAYQQLVDCPYQYFAAHCLELAPPEEIKEALQKSDYGVRVHRCLEAFHTNLPGLPGPFQEPVTEKNRNMAEQLLNQISQTVFSSDIEDNFMHRGWLRRWQSIIPLYIDWQIQQQKRFDTAATEINVRDAKLDDNITIKGRIDRIDGNEDQMAIIDYKTGYTPSLDDVISGEAVQLPFYLLLLMTDKEIELTKLAPMENLLTQALYVELDNPRKVASKTIVDHEQLSRLVEQNKQRLLDVTQQVKQGEELPAWGDADTCRYCPMDGLCRKQVWSS